MKKWGENHQERDLIVVIDETPALSHRPGKYDAKQLLQ